MNRKLVGVTIETYQLLFNPFFDKIKLTVIFFGSKMIKWLRLALALIYGCAWNVMPLNAATVQDDEAAYCSQAGGTVEEMSAIFDTKAGRVTGVTKVFCTFQADNGFLAIGLESFASPMPNIAATYMKALEDISNNSELWKGSAANPSHNVCKNLGGAEIGFVSTGGFTDQLGESDICVFGDGSMVSAWTLIYMANHRSGYDEIKAKVNAEPMQLNIPGNSRHQ